MKIIKPIAIALTVLVALFFILPVFLPQSFNVQRSMVIAVPPSAVFGQMNSYQKWEPWSPWLQRDSTIQNTYTGPQADVGNKVSWTSKNSGNGSMEITEVVPDAMIISKLTFEDFPPFQSRITLEPVSDGTKVTWADSGSAGYVGRWMFLMADKMMGPDFEACLANLKRHAESLPVLTDTMTVK